MTTFTSSLPNELLEMLNQVASQQKVPKNKVIEESLKMYFEELERQEYITSFKKLKDRELNQIAEEGMEDYANQLKPYG